MKTIAHFGTYIHDLSAKLNSIKQKQDEERRKLVELRTLLRSAPEIDRIEVCFHRHFLSISSRYNTRNASTQQNLTTDKGAGYSLHQLQGDKNHGITKSGHLLKKSEGKVRRVWQKRRCQIIADGFLHIYHADESKTPTRVNLLTCQIKPVTDDKRCFDLISCECFLFIVLFWFHKSNALNFLLQIIVHIIFKRKMKPNKSLGSQY